MTIIIPAGLIRLAKHGLENKIKGQGHSRFNESPEIIAAYNGSLNCTHALKTHGPRDLAHSQQSSNKFIT